MYHKYKFVFIYTFIIIGLGFWQLIDWYFISEDPIWHIMFYILIIPLISLLYGIFIGDEKRCFIMPFVAYVINLLVSIFMANGGYSFEIESLSLCLIPFIFMTIGIIIRKIPLFFSKKKLSK